MTKICQRFCKFSFLFINASSYYFISKLMGRLYVYYYTRPVGSQKNKFQGRIRSVLIRFNDKFGNSLYFFVNSGCAIKSSYRYFRKKRRIQLGTISLGRVVLSSSKIVINLPWTLTVKNKPI